MKHEFETDIKIGDILHFTHSSPEVPCIGIMSVPITDLLYAVGENKLYAYFESNDDEYDWFMAEVGVECFKDIDEAIEVYKAKNKKFGMLNQIVNESVDSLFDFVDILPDEG